MPEMLNRHYRIFENKYGQTFLEREREQALRKRLLVIVKSSCLVLLLFALVNCRDNKTEQDQVVIYTSLDKVFSEPILKAFERQTGIKVLDVYDSEATKTTGLVNRLIAEKNNPRADVFWNSEIGRTIVLKQKGVLTSYISPSANDIPPQFKDPDGYWTGFAARCRILIYNTDLLKEADLSNSIFELTQAGWKSTCTA